MIIPPKTYPEWGKLFEMIKNRTDDAEVLSAMEQGTIVWQAGVAERFTEKMIGAVNSRLDEATDKFQKNMQRARGSEMEIVRSIFTLRKELQFIYKIVSVPAIPEKYKTQYQKIIRDEANKMQQSLENSAKSDRTGKLASILRNNRVNTL